MEAKHIKQLIVNSERRLYKLKEQKALYGFSVDPKVSIEIEDIENDITRLKLEHESLIGKPEVNFGVREPSSFDHGIYDVKNEYQARRFKRNQQDILDDIDKRLEIMSYPDQDQQLAFIEYIPPHTPVLDRFIDRENEFQQLTKDFLSGHSIIITGIAGIGKTQLAAKLRNESFSDSSAIFWRSFTAADTIDSLVIDLASFFVTKGKTRTAYLLARGVENASVIKSLTKEIREDRLILFFDNYEIVGDCNIDNFLKEILSSGDSSQVILTTRQMPIWMTVRDIVNWEIKTIELYGFPADISSEYLLTYGIKLVDETIQLIHEKTKGHPLLLDLLTSQIIAYNLNEDDIQENFTELNLEVEQYLLDNIFNDLNSIEKEILTYLSVSFLKLTRKSINALLNEAFSNKQILDGLIELERKRLIHKTKFDYTIHAIVRDFIYEKIPNVKIIHSKMAKVLNQSDPNKSKIIQEIYRHHKIADEFEQASNLVRDKFDTLWSNGFREWSKNALSEITTFSKGNDDKKNTINDHMLLARIALETCEWEIVNNNYELANSLNSSIKDSNIDASIKNNWAEVYLRQGFYKRAISSYKDSHTILKSKDKTIESLIPMHNLASTYARYGHFEKAKTICSNVFNEFKSAKRLDLVVKSASLQALIALEEEDFDSALEWCSYDLEICEKQNDKNGVARVLNNMGIILVATGDLEQAMDKIKKSHEFNNEQGDMHAKAQAEANMGMIYQREKDFSLACSHYLKAFNVFLPIDDQISLIEIYGNINLLPSKHKTLFDLSSEPILKERTIEIVDQRLRFLWNISYGYLPIN